MNTCIFCGAPMREGDKPDECSHEEGQGGAAAWLGYYDVEVRTTNHPDTFTSQGVMWDSRERAEQEGRRLEFTWAPLLEWRVVAFGSEKSVVMS